MFNQERRHKWRKRAIVTIALLLGLGLYGMVGTQPSYGIIATYNVSLLADPLTGGTVAFPGITETTVAYDEGKTATVYATPAAGYFFQYWAGTSATTPPATCVYSFTVNNDYNLVAHFAKIGTPTITATSVGFDSIKISWGDVLGADHYDIYRSTLATTGFVKIGTTADKTYTNTGVTAGKTYYYKVTAGATYDYGDVQADVTTTGLDSAIKSAKPIPTKPAISVASSSYTSLKVSWAKVTGATGYNVYRATSSGGKYTLIKSVTGTSYTNSSLTTGKTYYYKVKAYCTAGGSNVYSDYSSYKSGKVVPSAPTASVITKTSTSAKVSWTAVSGVTKYLVYRATSQTGAYSLVATFGSSTKTYTNTSLTKGKTYYYKVRAYHLEGKTKVYGTYSDVKSIKIGDLYYSGLYKVGRDIPSGDYVVVSTKTDYAEFSISLDAAGDKEIGYGYPYPNRYVTLIYGQYVDFDYCKIYPLANAPLTAKNGDGNLISGEYKVGRDIEAGTYVLYPKDNSDYGGFDVDGNSLNLETSCITSDFLYGRTYVTVSEGQYLTIYDGVGYALADAPTVDVSNNYLQDGMYLVGTDIPAGTYTIKGILIMISWIMKANFISTQMRLTRIRV